MKTCAVIGLGYVGLGLAVALAKHYKVFAYDIKEERIAQLKKHMDTTQQVDSSALQSSSAIFTDTLADIRNAEFYIVAVSTPAYFYEIPNLDPLISAVKQLATIIKPNDIIVFESTVYPGTTEDICIPILEEISGLTCNQDFHVGYSPERINPGDNEHTLKTITKIISAQNKTALANIHAVYSSICDTVYPVSSIPIAESIKILENTQRDINIAFMNEFAKIMHAMDLDVHEVIEGAKTKWSFTPYKPGFVGGHCISIDPHYLAFQAKRVGIQPDLILTARKINDGMTTFVLQSLLKLLCQHKIDLKKIKVGVLGITYKENTNDIRNSLALKLIKEIKNEGFDCIVHDPFHQDYPTLEMQDFADLKHLTVIIIAVAHDFYKKLGLKRIAKQCATPKIIMDIPNLFVEAAKKPQDLIYWHL